MKIFIWHVITREQAIHLHVAKLFDVYKLYDDNSEGLAESVDDILNHQGEFGIEIDKYKIINEEDCSKCRAEAKAEKLQQQC